MTWDSVWNSLFVYRMQTTSILSKNDLIVSQSRLEGCDLALVKTSQGLYLNWQPHGSEGKASGSTGAFLTYGKVGNGFLFPVLKTDRQWGLMVFLKRKYLFNAKIGYLLYQFYNHQWNFLYISNNAYFGSNV